jgi:hypothetical protein
VYAQPRYLQDTKKASAKKPTKTPTRIQQKTPQRSVPAQDAPTTHRNTTATTNRAAVGATKQSAAELLRIKREKAAADIAARKQGTVPTASTRPQHISTQHEILSAGQVDEEEEEHVGGGAGDLIAVDSALDQTVDTSDERHAIIPQSITKSSTIDRQRLQEMREKRMANYFIGNNTAKKVAPSAKAPPTKAPSTSTKTVVPSTAARAPPTAHRVAAAPPSTQRVATHGSTSTKRAATTIKKVQPTPAPLEDDEDVDNLNSTVYQQPDLAKPKKVVANVPPTATAVLETKSLPSMQTELWIEQNQVLQLMLASILLDDARKQQHDAATEAIWQVSQHVEEMRQRIAQQEQDLTRRKAEWFSKQLSHQKGAWIKPSTEKSLNHFMDQHEELGKHAQGNAMRMPTHAVDVKRASEASQRLHSAAQCFGANESSISEAEPRWRGMMSQMATVERTSALESSDLLHLANALASAAGISAVERSLVTSDR